MNKMLATDWWKAETFFFAQWVNHKGNAASTEAMLKVTALQKE